MLKNTAWIALIILVSLASADAVLSPAPVPKQSNFIDTFLASKAVVVAIRIAVIFAALFVVLSVAALIVRRQWLTRVGPVEVSDRVFRLSAENQRLEECLADAYQTIENLERSAASSQRLIDREKGL